MKLPPANGVRAIDHPPGRPYRTLRRLASTPAALENSTRTRTPGLHAIAPPAASPVHPFVQEMRAFSAANASKLRAENLRILREKGSADPEVELAALEKDWRKNQKLLMRRSARGLMGLLLEGRIKTAYEVSDKRVDPKYLTYREEVERNIGYFEHRPCYGYVAFDESMKDAPTEFGDIVLTLKPERYKNRVTCCEFDSFDQLTREAFVEKVFSWEDGRRNEAVTLADLAGVELPADARFDLIAEEVRRRAPGVKVTRKHASVERAPIAPAAVSEGAFARAVDAQAASIGSSALAILIARSK